MNKRIAFSLLFISCFASIWAQQPASLNIQFLGQVSYPNNQLSNLWGYVAPNGTEYAIVGTEMGVSIVSLANPTNPVEVEFIPGVQTIWREVKVYEDYAYIGNEGGDGLRIIDLKGLPNSIVYKDTIMRGIETIHTVSETDGFLYLNGTNIGNGGLQIFDLRNDPWRPEYVGEYTTRYVHDCYVRGNTCYAGEINDGLFTIIDITNKANPVVVNTHSYTNSFTHNTWLNTASNVCFTTDEKDAAYIYAWDITNPTNIQERDNIRSILSAGASIPHNIHVLNNYGVTSYYKDGVVIFDVDQADNLVEVGYYDTSPQTGGGFAGAWGVFPYFPSGNIIVSDIEEGLFVLRPTYVRGCYLKGNVTDAVTGQAIQGATIAIQNAVYPEYSNLLGKYNAGTSTAGTYDVIYSKAGYIPDTFTLSLTNGVTITQNVALQPVQQVSIGLTVRESWYPYNVISGASVGLNDGVGLNYALTTNANGQISNTIAGTSYQITAGKWGFVTTQQNINATSGYTGTVYLDQGYWDEFYFDFGWTESGSAVRGNWEKGEPQGTATQTSLSNPEIDASNDIGDECYVTGNGGGNVGDDDVDNGSTLLTSPVMDLSTYLNPVITYSWWMMNIDLANQGAINDHFKLQLTNGNQTVTVKDYTGVHNQWNYDSIVVSQHLTPSANMRLILDVTDSNPGHILEGAFDKFAVKGAPNKNSVSIQDISQTSFSLYPNPAQEQFTLQYDFPTTTVAPELCLHDLQGKMVACYRLQTTSAPQTLTCKLPNGYYIAEIRSNDKTIARVKLIKQ